MASSQIRYLCLMLTIAAACCGPALARERPTTTPAAQFVQTTIMTAFDLATPPVTAERNAGLEALMEAAMDWPHLTQFAIGRYRADLGDGAMVNVKTKLKQRLADLARRAGREFGTLTLAVTDLRIDAEGYRHVISTVILPRFGEIEVQWTLAPVRGGYRIADIAAFGLTLRQFLRGWVTALIAGQGGDPAPIFGQPPNDRCNDKAHKLC